MASSKPDLCARTLDRLRALSVTSEDALLVAVSGGMDSMSLLSVLCMLRDDSEVRTLAAVHVNHLLRGEASESDERLVRRQCEEHRVPLEVRRMDALSYARGRKLGIEEAARECRYQAFEECAKELAIRYVLTAHTANDQVETILMNIVRGAGLRGIAGIPASRQSGDVTILRPWLSVTRGEIEAYQSEVDLAYSTDATNAELTFQRNRVRHIVVPALQQAFPDRDVLRAFAMLAERAAGLSQTVQWVAEQELAKALSGGPGLELSTLRSLPNDVASEVIELWICESIGRYRLSSDERSRLVEFIAQDSGKLQLAGVTIVCGDGRLCLEDIPERFTETPLRSGEAIRLHQGELIARSAEQVQLDACHLYFSTERLSKLRIRPWQDEDRMSPFGMAGHRKLISDLLTDSGITGSLRMHYPVVEDRETGEIIWVPGVRGSEGSRIDRGAELNGLIELCWSPNSEQ